MWYLFPTIDTLNLYTHYILGNFSFFVNDVDIWRMYVVLMKRMMCVTGWLWFLAASTLLNETQFCYGAMARWGQDESLFFMQENRAGTLIEKLVFKNLQINNSTVRLSSVALGPVQRESEGARGRVHQSWPWQEAGYQLRSWHCKRKS